jgi:hypothetical protein
VFTKILHRPALAIVISLILLFLGGLSPSRRCRSRSSRPSRRPW